MTEQLVVGLERTSQGKAGGQDTEAQAADTMHRARLAGFPMHAMFKEDGVSGATPWSERKKGLVPALALARRLNVPLLVRHPDRLWRGEPELGILQVETIPDLEVLDNPRWRRRAGAWTHADASDHLSRYIDMWAAYRDREDDLAKSEKVTTAIHEGRRATKSGKPPHRPPAEIDPDHLSAAREVYERTGSMSEAHREVRRLRGFYEAKDQRTVKARDVSRSKVGEALGVYKRERVAKPLVSQRGARSAADESDAKRPLPDTTKRDASKTPDEKDVDSRGVDPRSAGVVPSGGDSANGQ